MARVWYIVVGVVILAALCIWLYLDVPAVTELVSPFVEPVLSRGRSVMRSGADVEAVAAAVAKYRGPMPRGTLLAICEHESNFHVDAGSDVGKGPGGRIVTRDLVPHSGDRAGVCLGQARGPWQVMDCFQLPFGVGSRNGYWPTEAAWRADSWRPDPRVWDVESSTAGVCQAMLRAHTRIVAKAPGNFEDPDYLFFYSLYMYATHWAGWGRSEGLMDGVADINNRASVVGGLDGYSWISAREKAGLIRVADAAVSWHARYGGSEDA